ncbi:hypothetical protein IWX49DRAFT_585652 [Phyllosticta citricarpa]|uniref:Uncharacterized protein n=1 Tax=Phyllosticta paracitricarpa TaxID=2016321 RepID=A0ABR1MSJ9_9PEZI
MNKKNSSSTSGCRCCHRSVLLHGPCFCPPTRNQAWLPSPALKRLPDEPGASHVLERLLLCRKFGVRWTAMRSDSTKRRRRRRRRRREKSKKKIQEPVVGTRTSFRGYQVRCSFAPSSRFCFRVLLTDASSSSRHVSRLRRRNHRVPSSQSAQTESDRLGGSWHPRRPRPGVLVALVAVHLLPHDDHQHRRRRRHKRQVGLRRRLRFLGSARLQSAPQPQPAGLQRVGNAAARRGARRCQRVPAAGAPRLSSARTGVARGHVQVQGHYAQVAVFRNVQDVGLEAAQRAGRLQGVIDGRMVIGCLAEGSLVVMTDKVMILLDSIQ